MNKHILRVVVLLLVSSTAFAAVKNWGYGDFSGTSGDTKPAVNDGARFYETDTKQVWLRSGGTWTLTSAPSATAPAGTTCSGTDKLSAYSAATGTFACSADQTGSGGGITGPGTTTSGNLVTWNSTTGAFVSQPTGTEGHVYLMNSVATVTQVYKTYKQTHAASHTTTTPISIVADIIECTTDGDQDEDVLYLPEGLDGQQVKVIIKSNGHANDKFTIYATLRTGATTYSFGAGSAGNSVTLVYSTTATAGWTIVGWNTATTYATYAPADQNFTSTTAAASTWLTIPAVANKTYTYECYMLVTSSSTTNLVRFALAAPASTTVSRTSLRATSATAITNSTIMAQWASTCTGCDATGGTSLTTANVPHQMRGVALTTNSGSLTVYVAVTFNGNQNTLKAGSSCIWRMVN